jgi:sulfonate transport system ATP-binding protein
VALGDRVIVMSPKLANIKKQIIVNIPRPRSIDHPLVDSITREIISESNDLFVNDPVKEPETTSEELNRTIISAVN